VVSQIIRALWKHRGMTKRTVLITGCEAQRDQRCRWGERHSEACHGEPQGALREDMSARGHECAAARGENGKIEPREDCGRFWRCHLLSVAFFLYHVDCADKSAWSKVRSSRDFGYIFSRTCALAFELRPVYCPSAAPRPPCTAVMSRCCRCDNPSHVTAAANDVALQTLQVTLPEPLPTHRVTHTALRFPRAVDCETGCRVEWTRPPRELGLLVAPCMD